MRFCELSVAQRSSLINEIASSPCSSRKRYRYTTKIVRPMNSTTLIVSVHPSLILASASPRRLALLEQIGIHPNLVISPDSDESVLPQEQPVAYAKRVALAKAQAVRAHYPDARILAADTVVACGNRILPKAEDETTARRCLVQLSGRRHRVTTAVALLQGNAVKLKAVTTIVRFSRLTADDINWYIATGEWEGKAGGYAIQGAAQRFIPFISGSVSNVIGLPLEVVSGWLHDGQNHYLQASYQEMAADLSREREAINDIID